MNDIVAIVGKGLLAQLVSDQLSEQYKVNRQVDFKLGVPESAKLVVVLHDDWRPSDYETAEKAMQLASIPWLRGSILHDEGIIGPLVQPGKSGCSQCADLRSFMAGHDRENSLELQLNLLLHGAIPSDRSTSRIGVLQTSCLVAAEARKFIQGEPAQTEGRVYFVDLNTLKSSLHPFLPDPSCPVCGNLPNDCPDNARISLQPSHKINMETYRCKPLDDLAEIVIKDYLDERTGLFNKSTIDLLSPFSNVAVNLPLAIGNETSAGRSHSYAQSELTAILEGLERYCGIFPRSKRTVIHDAYRNLTDRALNPVEVGVYSAEQYEQAEFPFKPFDPDLPMNWVWGYTFKQERPILVPEQLAYYSSGFGDGFVMEGSNGCALGGSLEEAIFYGIMEVVERDSFLLTWYAQLPVPRLDPYSSGDKELLLMINRLQDIAGYDIYLFNATMESGIPSVWAIAKNKEKTGANLICAGGAHLDPIRAAKSAILEVAGNVIYLGEMLNENSGEYYGMLDDPYLVRRMEDHSLLYSLPETEERLHFLLKQNGRMRTFDEEFQPRALHADLTNELKDVLQKIRLLNLDVIVIDQTAPEALRNGLYCVKVLIPGMLPMSFGHHLVRLTGLERLLKVPVTLGYAKNLLRLQELNPYPHPFL
ncbi:TOMM precursor leader peptide-binding protein [Cohnella luojiensis]|uniref:TOMM leader peptide-binding protein n=1 Tax=Cohnella luojiensis TaxID=652876 RepID=A0A4Y8M1A1_9BACL|nr:TOMM precursor leader peptide-binding protein [Cohnella luojiensis]TFE26269.1 TOMM precursor leader peptide-binding protein [Cohnella luojiensis]